MLPWKRKPSLPQSVAIPPVFSPPVTKLALCATEAGLVLWRVSSTADQAPHPTLARHSKQPPYRGPATLVHYGNEGYIDELEAWDEAALESAEAVRVRVDGCVGLLRAFEDGYLIVCTQSRVVAHVFDASHAVHQVTELHSIRLERTAAKGALAKLAARQQQRPNLTHAVSSSSDTTESESEDDDDGEAGDPQTAPATPQPQLELLSTDGEEADDSPLPQPTPTKKRSPIRPFWQRRFTPRTMKRTAAEPKMDDSDAESERPSTPTKPSFADKAAIVKGKEREVVTAVEEAGTDEEYHAARRALDKRLVRAAEAEMVGMYWSPTVDITRSMQHKYESQHVASGHGSNGSGAGCGGLSEPLSRLPMWRRVDRRFWWNEYIANLDGLRGLTICLMQGCIRQVTVPLPLQPYSVIDPSETPTSPGVVPVELTLISRRSIERPGVRYQRRGVDQNGSVANMVETEFVIGTERDAVKHVCSFVQTRGSIPVYWKQSPWSAKPAPMLDGTPEESQAALAKHFKHQVEVYGRQIIMNLAETKGKEAVVVGAYRDGVKQLERPDVEYNEWDFHHECKGMRFENVSKLIAIMEDELEDISCFWTTAGQVFSTQSGVVRTNCIDCLDRTNVVQSALGRHILNRHLVHLGITSQIDGENSELVSQFNSIWADNGDAISRQYAGTSALKGDFTRTGKRDLVGVFNDASNSVTRLLVSWSSDFFRQAVIEYVTGQNLAVFDNFQERMEAADPGELLKLAKIRQAAVDTSFASTLVEGEHRVQGWTFLSPVEPNVVRSPKGVYEEKILLLSDKAIYSVSYSYTLQKVSEFVRVPLGDVTGIQQGAYFTSVQGAHDPQENWGLVISYRTGHTDQRARTYSLKVKINPSKRPAFPGFRRSTSLASVASTAPSEPDSSAAQAAEEPKADAHAAAATEGEDAAGEAIFAFKALRRDALRLATDETGSRLIERRREESAAGTRTTRLFVREVIDALRAECTAAGAVAEGDEGWVVEKDLISLADARKNAGWTDALSHSVKRMFWG